VKWKEVGLLEHLVLCLRATYFNCLKILPCRHEIRYETEAIREHLKINISKVCHNTRCLLSCTQQQVTNGYPDQKNNLHRFRQHSFALNFGLFLLILPAEPTLFLPFMFPGITSLHIPPMRYKSST